ncbi:MAG: ABC transporter permease [Agathobacter sp.]|nr:ABC transporter permease [Agathobacter sp.]MDY5863607.1 ABC transporter permease [Agathobacter sp.]
MMKKIKRETVISVVVVICIFVLWFVSTANAWVDTKLIPSPKQVWKAFLDACKDYKGHSLLQHMGVSMQRLFSAFGLAVITAVPLGLLSGFSKTVRAILEPIIEFYRPLPPLAYYTLLVLALGIDNASKIALLYLACFAPIYVSCVSAVVRVNKDHINSAYTLGANKGQVFFSVIFPSCLPDMFTGLKTSIGVGYSTLVAAEMVAANAGIGWMVLDAKNWLRNDIVFVGIIIMGITGILINVVLGLLEKKLVPWSGKA